MASKSKPSLGVELRESEIPLPKPLRIVKRCQTITCSSAAPEVESRGRGLSICSDESRGSPPMTFNRPLTVHKRRGTRSSVLSENLEVSPPTKTSDGSTIAELVERNAKRAALEDADLTPKAVKRPPRTVSAGAFLKSEFHCVTRSTDSDICIDLAQLNAQGEQLSPPNVPERRLSKSKTLFFNFSGRNDKKPKSIRKTDSTSFTSKSNLVRRFSRGPSHGSNSNRAYTGSITSTDLSYSLDRVDSETTASIIVNPRISSHHREFLHSHGSESLQNLPAYAKEECILCPEITITPEVLSLDGGSTNLWVAVEITGTLRPASSLDHSSRKFQERRKTLSGYTPAHLRDFGQLQSMRINLVTTRDSSILEVVGNLHESKTLFASETHLILAKLRIAKVTKANSHIRESSTSDEIMADLENHLGGAVTSYLTVHLTYKHSGFCEYNRTTLDLNFGMSSHSTKLQTEASAFIKRHNLESTWSPRTSREINGPRDVNPLIKLIEMHFSVNDARDAIRRLAGGRIPIPMARRMLHGSERGGGSSEETVRASTRSSVTTRINSAASMSILQPQDNVRPRKNSDAQSLAPPVSEVIKATVEIDPARKIWTEMRRNSRGYRHPRGSISADHYVSNDLDDFSPCHLSSADSMSEERMKIKDMALRNKRSVGADTLKSFAPSVGKAKGGTISGLGLGVGRSWWVGGNWW